MLFLVYVRRIDSAAGEEVQLSSNSQSLHKSYMLLIETEQGLTSHHTHYRSYRGRFLQVIWPNQQCQSTEGN